jgi:hypothetical protein
MSRLAALFLGALVALGGCSKQSRRDAVMDLRPRLSAIRGDLVGLAPSLPDIGKVTSGDLPAGALEIDAVDAARDNTIVIGLGTLRDPYDRKLDDVLEVGFAYHHRYLGCLRDVSDGSKSGDAPADEGYRASCQRAADARYALVYRVARHTPARFELPKGGELLFEPGEIVVEWFVVDLGPPEARAAKLVGQLVTSAKTPETLDLSFDKGAEPGLVEARRQAAAGLARSILDELSRALVGKARHVSL